MGIDDSTDDEAKGNADGQERVVAGGWCPCWPSPSLSLSLTRCHSHCHGQASLVDMPDVGNRGRSEHLPRSRCCTSLEKRNLSDCVYRCRRHRATHNDAKCQLRSPSVASARSKSRGRVEDKGEDIDGTFAVLCNQRRPSKQKDALSESGAAVEIGCLGRRCAEPLQGTQRGSQPRRLAGQIFHSRLRGTDDRNTWARRDQIAG